MKIRFMSLALAAALFGAVAVGTANNAAAQDTTVVQKNGAAGLVAAVVGVQAAIVNNGTIDVAVVELNNSLNNLRALNNVLNNNDVDITVYALNDVIDIVDSQILTDFLNNNTDLLDVIVGVGVLSGGDFIVFTGPVSA